MINAILYGILAFACFVAIVTGKRTLIYASALLMPAIQVMPSPGGPPTSAPNLIVLGLIAGAFFHTRRRERPAAGIEEASAMKPGAVASLSPANPGAPATGPRDATTAAASYPHVVPSLEPVRGAAPELVTRPAPSFVRGPDTAARALGAGPGGVGTMAVGAGSAGAAESVAVSETPLEWSAAPSRAGARTKLPLRGAILFLSLMLLVGLAIRWLNEEGGAEYLNPFSQAARDTWYRITAFVVYALIFRQLLHEPTDKVLRRIVMLCQISFAAECGITMVERALDIGRATAHLEEANRAGAFFAAAAAFFFAAFLLRTGKWRWLFFGGWLLAVGAVFNSLSRGAMAATCVSTLVVLSFAFFTGRLTGGTKAILVLLLIVAAVNAPFLVPERVKARVLSTFGGAAPVQGEDVELDASAEERLLLWSIGWMLVRDNPFGYGALTYQDLVLPYHDKAKVAHNIYLQLLVENGVEGLLALLILVAAVLTRLTRSYFRARTHDQAVLALCLIGWWTAHLSAHFFVNSFFHLQVTGQFWMMLACLFALQQTAAQTANGAVPAPGTPATTGPGVGLRRPAWS